MMKKNHSAYQNQLEQQHQRSKTRLRLEAELFFACLIIFFVWLFFISRVGQDNQVKIGSTYMTMNNNFYPVINEQVASQVNQKHDLLINRDPALKVSQQVAEIHSFIKQHVNAIIINPVNGNSTRLERALEQARRNGIKVVVVDSQMKSSRYVNCTILSDNYAAGRLCAQQLMRQRRQARILVLQQASALSVDDRIRGFITTLRHNKKAQNYHIMKRVNTNGQAETTLPLVAHLLRKQPHSFNAVMCLNDQVAVGTLAAIDVAHLHRQINVYSVDGSENIKQLLGKNKNVQATAAQSPIHLGQTAIKVTYRLLHHQAVPHRIVLPVHLITKQNIAHYNVVGWQ